jgi:hypothetical protein
MCHIWHIGFERISKRDKTSLIDIQLKERKYMNNLQKQVSKFYVGLVFGK